MFCSRIPQHTLPTLFPYTTLFRSYARHGSAPSRRPTQPLLPPVPWEWLERATARTEEQAWGIRTSGWSSSKIGRASCRERGESGGGGGGVTKREEGQRDGPEGDKRE